METTFSLDHFEQLVYTQQHVQASLQLVTLLARLQQTRGELDESFQASGLIDLSPEEQRQRFCTRLTSAVSTLFADPDFQLPPACSRPPRQAMRTTSPVT
jgi:hypothetical protein